MDKKLQMGQLVMLVLAIVGVIIVARMPGNTSDHLKLAIGFALLLLVFFFGMTIIVEIVRGNIDLKDLLEEIDGGASMSRFQLLIFTFVIALGFFYLTVSAEPPVFPNVPPDVLTLLGISATTYAVSKGIQVGSGNTGGTPEQTPPAPGGTATGPQTPKP